MCEQNWRRCVKGENVLSNIECYEIPCEWKHGLAIIRLHNIGTGHNADSFNFHRKVVCEDHFTEQSFKKDVEHSLLGLPERKLLKEDVVPTEFVHRHQAPDSFAVARAQRSRKREERKIRL